MLDPLPLSEGLEWIIDAFGCDPALLRDASRLSGLFGQVIEELGLHPVGPIQVHTFPGPGGITAMQLLSESHLTAHTFPEREYVAFNLYCCRVRPDWPWSERLREMLGAKRVTVRRLERGKA